jgi:hypothetical protein
MLNTITLTTASGIAVLRTDHISGVCETEKITDDFEVNSSLLLSSGHVLYVGEDVKHVWSLIKQNQGEKNA